MIDFDKVHPDKTVIVVVDLQKDFCAPDNFAVKNWGHDVSHFEEIIDRIGRFYDEAQARNIDIVYTKTVYHPDKISNALRKKLGPFVGQYAAPDSEGIEFYRINPPEEKVFVKHGFSIFKNPDFVDYLNKRGIETLIFVGFNSSICVESSARDALEHGFHPIIVRDLVGNPSFMKSHEEETLKTFEIIFGDVAFSSDILDLWKKGDMKGGIQNGDK